MPRKELNYDKTYFYKIVCKDLNIKDCYVGHTLNFKNRKSAHKRTCYNENDREHFNSYVYQFIRNSGGFENFDMILIQTERCENRLDALRKEREYIEQLNATLNKTRPTRTPEEAKQYRLDYYEENKEDIKHKNKQYRDDNADIVREQTRKYRNQAHVKEYMKQKNKEWRENNEQYAEKRKVKYSCDCGGSYTCGHKMRHERTNKHQEYLKSLQPEETPEQ